MICAALLLASSDSTYSLGATFWFAGVCHRNNVNTSSRSPMETNPRPTNDSAWVVVEITTPPVTLVGIPLVPLTGKVPVPLTGKVPVLVNEKVPVLVNEIVVEPVVPPRPALTAGSLYAMRSSPANTITVLKIRSFRSKLSLAAQNSYI